MPRTNYTTYNKFDRYEKKEEAERLRRERLEQFKGLKRQERERACNNINFLMHREATQKDGKFIISEEDFAKIIETVKKGENI